MDVPSVSGVNSRLSIDSVNLIWSTLITYLATPG